MKLRKQDSESSCLPLFSTDENLQDEKIKDAGNVKTFLGMIQFSLIWKSLIVWLFLVHFFEREYTSRKIDHCKVGGNSHLVAFIADPQIVDSTSYENRFWLINYFAEKLSDNYLHRNYMYIQRDLDPDTTIFLGDLFDGGRELNGKAWLKDYRRFSRIFPKKQNRRNIQSLPGNHDIGFEKIDPNVVNRFASFFGDANRVIEIANYSFIFLDTISLSSKDENIRNNSADFLNNIHRWLHQSKPRILLTHVPLFRQNQIEGCGPLRESKKLFPVQKGVQYQTVIEGQLLKEILEKVNPHLVFSGDDHDYCEVLHQNDGREVIKEITVKSASMTSGIKYPAIQLLKLDDPLANGVPRTETFMCTLPAPYFVLKVYVFSYVIFVFIIVASYSKELARNLGFLKGVIQQYFPYNSLSKAKAKDLHGSFVIKQVMLGIAANIALLSSLCYVILSIYYSAI